MTTQAEHSGIRITADNPNHHLWNNHGTWFLHYTVHPTPSPRRASAGPWGPRTSG